MALRIGFFQFELSHPNNAPHVGMSLIAPDLVRDGHEVDACLVGARHVPDLLRRIEAGGHDLVGLDSIFPIDVVNQIKDAFPELPVVVGGVNALALFLASAADLAVVGPGRVAVRSLARALAAGTGLDEVPNLYYRQGRHFPRGEGQRGGGPGALAAAASARPIDHTGRHRAWNVEEEVLPYEPLLDWDYLGSGREPAANRRLLSIVPEFGCPYQQDALALPGFAPLHKDDSPAEILPHLDIHPRAAAAMRAFIGNTGGCSFCVFRFQDLTLLDTERTVALLMTQVRHLQQVAGVREFSLQSENPLRVLRPFLARLAAMRIPADRVAIRTMATILLAKADELRRALVLAREHGTQIILQQIGFESFDQEQLDRFNKGISVADNRRAARLLAELKAEFGDTLEPFSGHGLILFDPWTTPESLGRNLGAIAEDAPFLLPAVGVQSKLVFYDPFNPIFRLAQKEGLLVPSPHDYGWDFRFADPRTADFVQMVLALDRHLRKRLAARGETDFDGGPGSDQDSVSSRGYRRLETELFRRALASYLAHGADAAAQRQEFFALARWVDAVLEARDSEQSKPG
jgi:radical SAM superfamily enzyme YgiQ (UPF0313 family)